MCPVGVWIRFCNKLYCYFTGMMSPLRNSLPDVNTAFTVLEKWWMISFKACPIFTYFLLTLENGKVISEDVPGDSAWGSLLWVSVWKTWHFPWVWHPCVGYGVNISREIYENQSVAIPTCNFCYWHSRATKCQRFACSLQRMTHHKVLLSPFSAGDEHRASYLLCKQALYWTSLASPLLTFMLETRSP